jgi:HEAT repeat protein
MMFYSSSQADKRSFQPVSPEPSPEPMSSDVAPPVGTTPPYMLAQDAAAGRRGAAWRLLHWIMENDPRAIEAISALKDERLAQNFVEFIALGTWAGKPFHVPAPLRTPYARTRLRTLFVSPSGIDARIGERVLLADLHDDRQAVREAAMYILGLMGSTAAIPQLIASLHDPSPSTRLQAAKALGRSGSPEAVPALLDALHGADEQQSSQIFMALTNLGHIAVPALMDTSYSPSSWMRWHSIRALCEIRDQRAFPTLVRALNDRDHSVAWMAAKGLAPFGKECVEPVLHLLATAEMTPWLVETSSYVLNYQCQNYAELKPYLEPVIHQMHQPAYRSVTSYAALKALEQLENSGLLLK